MKKDILLKRVEEELLPPDKYLKLTKKEKSNIVSSKIVPPKLGERGFGNIRVFYRNPIYKAG